MRVFQKTLAMGLAVALLSPFSAWADDPITNPGQPAQSNPHLQGKPQGTMPQMKGEIGDRTMVIRSLPAKKLAGANVNDTKGEKLGTIEDLVIDLESGRVAYVAVSVGGVLGIGDKLFAVPFEEFKTAHDTSNNISFVLDVSKERLANAPGFDKSHWPDFANRDWRNKIDTYYRQSSANRSATEQNPTESR